MGSLPLNTQDKRPMMCETIFLHMKVKMSNIMGLELLHFCFCFVFILVCASNLAQETL